MRTVLLIDDEPSMAPLVSMCLEDADASVVHAENLAAALEEADRCSPRVILLDLSLGPEDGLQILPKLRAHPALSNVPVVVFSVHDSRRPEALKQKVSGFLRKPFKSHELRSQLSPYLR
jgi:DNA-binding response OmpR family regulator